MRELILFLSIIIGLVACSESDPSFSKDVAPLVYEKCTPCHRPNQIGKFNLITYEDLVLNKDKVLYTTREKLMPPWPADPHYTSFDGENYLSDEQMAMLEKWYALDMPIGDSNRIPAVPIYPSGSLIGEPDVRVPVLPFLVKGNFDDRFLVIKVPFELPKDTFIKALEFVPGNAKVVHHVNGDMVRFDYDKKKNVFDGAIYDDLVWDSTIRQVYEKIGLLHDDKSYPILTRAVVNYLPGVIGTKYPEGIGGWKVNRKSAFLLNDLHYGPYYDNVWDSSYINIFYAKETPKRPVQEFTMGTLGVTPINPPLVIPANEIKTFTTKYTLPEKISVLTVNPHMHLLGKNFIAYALSPAGDTTRLIKIPKWDFNWQFFYTYKQPVILEKGHTIVVEATFDNTKDNPYNPNKPPKTIVGRNDASMRTVDEMFQFIVSFLPYQEGDEGIDLSK